MVHRRGVVGLAGGVAPRSQGRTARGGPGEPRHVRGIRVARAPLTRLPSRAVLRRPLAIAALLCVLVPPAAALAQNPFGPLPQPVTPTTTTSTTSNGTTTSGDSGGLASWQEVLIFLG